ncbi:molecular chaperone HtpG [uncultured Olegusella sp.]|uniref:molecular chaperone HtpG n=1 Tax=uncultured Olegusella sp. TaxID=1979846 RepID=UPI002608E2BE|nr:molecular chaperone HtpG [uncultured Olegusella sp.]
MHQFKTESKKLLDLMINSIYTNREIFLRELVSNASDAVDKLYFASLTDPTCKLGDDELQIRLSVDKDTHTLTISDNGIGMSAEELDRNLGTIAHSGSEEFKAANVQAADEKNEENSHSAAEIIGQFGVGFYSAFMVAKNVRVVSRAFGSDEAHVWESNGLDGYSVMPIAADALLEGRNNGTDVILTLRDDTDDEKYSDYLEEWQLRNLIKRYSNYVRYPVRMLVTKSRQKPAPEPKPEDYTPEWEEYTELETLNSMTPIWRRRPSEVSQDEYDEFYEQSFHDYSKPLRTFSLHAEGTLEYNALLFVPSEPPFDLYSRDYEKGLQLYSRGVLIQDKCADLLPDYYNFVHGVVDSPDIALNISRETLQQTRQLQAIARRVERKISSELQTMRDDAREDYEKFFEHFGRGLKYGIYASYGAKKDSLANLLLYWSAKQGRLVTLAEYVAAMPEGQDVIYYAAGEDRERLEKMPVVHSVLDHGFDVLLMTEDVDEFCLQMMRDYSWTPEAKEGEEAKERTCAFKNVSSGELDLATDEEKKQAEETADENKELLEAMKSALGDAISKVAVSPLATDAPAVIASEGPISLEMERVISEGPEGMPQIGAQRVLQLNATHPVFEKLRAAQQAGDTDKLNLMSSLLLDQALLMAGLPVKDPVSFAQNVCKLMA